MTCRSTIALAAAIVVATSAPAQAGYRVTTIDAPASPALLGTVVDGINNFGVAAGYYVVAGDPSLGQPPQSYVGFTVNADGSNFTSFARSGYEQTGVSGINDAGTTVGVSVVTYGTGNGFARTAGGTYTDIVPVIGGITSAYSEAIGIGNNGDIVGFYTETLPPSIDTIQNYAHGFILSGGVFTQFDVPGVAGFGTELFSMNSSGTITGSFLDNSPYHLAHGFIFNPNSGFTVPSAGAELSSSIGAINDRGNFGFSALSYDPLSPVGYDAAPYVSRGGVITALNVPGAFSAEIQGINNHDDVTGYYINATGVHGFIAQAVPEPATWVLLLTGFALTGAMVRRRGASTSSPE